MMSTHRRTTTSSSVSSNQSRGGRGGGNNSISSRTNDDHTAGETETSSYEGSNSFTGHTSLTSSVQIARNENTLETGLQSLTNRSARQSMQRGEISTSGSTYTKELSLPSSFGGDGGTLEGTLEGDSDIGSATATTS